MCINLQTFKILCFALKYYDLHKLQVLKCKFKNFPAFLFVFIISNDATKKFV